jgi:hypothetical protein
VPIASNEEPELGGGEARIRVRDVHRRGRAAPRRQQVHEPACGDVVARIEGAPAQDERLGAVGGHAASVYQLFKPTGYLRAIAARTLQPLFSHLRVNTMSSIPSTHEKLPSSLILLLAASAGFGVAALYYSQPMLGVLGPDIGASARSVGFVPTLTQLGYALGILLLAPLGDRFDRRRIILAKAGVLVLALLGAALAVGRAAAGGQPGDRPGRHPGAGRGARRRHAGARGAPRQDRRHGDDRAAAGHPAVARAQRLRGRALRLARDVRGGGGQHRLHRRGRRARPAAPAPDHAAGLRRAAGFAGQAVARHGAAPRGVAQALLSVGFSAFWSTLAVMLHGAPFHLGSAAAGAFGLAGAAGALAAPLAGRWPTGAGRSW